MHVYFMTRGIKHQRDIAVKFLQTQMFPWKRKNLKTGQEEIAMVQGALRPIELWEYVLPEESLDEFLTMIGTEKGGVNTGGHFSKVKQAAIRKMLGNGVKKIPKTFKPLTEARYIERRGLAIYPIGIKKDKRQKWEEAGYEQEML